MYIRSMFWPATSIILTFLFIIITYWFTKLSNPFWLLVQTPQDLLDHQINLVYEFATSIDIAVMVEI